MSDQLFGLLITWTCYGTWLPGDSRGYVSNTPLPGGGVERKQNISGTEYRTDVGIARQLARRKQSHETVVLTAREARCAAESLVAAANERAWRLVRAAVMHNHVHVLAIAVPDDGPAVRRVLKGNSQAALSMLAGHPRRWWTAGGSDRYLRGESAIEAAARYVADQHGILAEIIGNVVQ